MGSKSQLMGLALHPVNFEVCRPVWWRLCPIKGVFILFPTYTHTHTHAHNSVLRLTTQIAIKAINLFMSVILHILCILSEWATAKHYQCTDTRLTGLLCCCGWVAVVTNNMKQPFVVYTNWLVKWHAKAPNHTHPKEHTKLFLFTPLVTTQGD